MLNINSFVDSQGNEIDLSNDEAVGFAEQNPDVQKVTRFRSADGKTDYAVKDSEMDEFRKYDPTAVQLRRVRKVDGTMHDIEMTPQGWRDFNREYRSSDAWAADREEEKVSRKALAEKVRGMMGDPTTAAISGAVGGALEGAGRGAIGGVKSEAGAFLGIGTGAMRLFGSAASLVNSDFGRKVIDTANSVDSWYDRLGKTVDENGEIKGDVTDVGYDDWMTEAGKASGSFAGGVMSWMVAGKAGLTPLMVANAVNDSALQTYDTAIENGFSPDQARGFAAVNGLVNGAGTLAMMKMPIGRMMKKFGIGEKFVPKELASIGNADVKTTSGYVNGLVSGLIKQNVMQHAMSAIESGGIMGAQTYLSTLVTSLASGIDLDEALDEAKHEGIKEGVVGAVGGGVLGAVHMYGGTKKGVAKRLNAIENMAPEERMRQFGTEDAGAAKKIALLSGQFGISRANVEAAWKQTQLNALATPEGRSEMYKHNPAGFNEFAKAVREGREITPDMADKAFLPTDLSQAEYVRIAGDYEADANSAFAEYERIGRSRAAAEKNARISAVKDMKEAEAAEKSRLGIDEEGVASAFRGGAIEINERNTREMGDSWARLLRKNNGDVYAAEAERKTKIRELKRAAEGENESPEMERYRAEGRETQRMADFMADNYPEEYARFCEQKGFDPKDSQTKVYFLNYVNGTENVLGAKPVEGELVDRVPVFEQPARIGGESPRQIPAMDLGTPSSGERDVQTEYLRRNMERGNGESPSPVPTQKGNTARIGYDESVVSSDREQRRARNIERYEEAQDMARSNEGSEEASVAEAAEDYIRTDSERLAKRRAEWMKENGVPEYEEWTNENGILPSPLSFRMYENAVRARMAQLEGRGSAKDSTADVFKEAAKIVQSEFEFGMADETAKSEKPAKERKNASVKKAEEKTEAPKTEVKEEPKPVEEPVKASEETFAQEERKRPSEASAEKTADEPSAVKNGDLRERGSVSDEVLNLIGKNDAKLRAINERYRDAYRKGEDTSAIEKEFRDRVAALRKEVNERRKVDTEIREPQDATVPETPQADFTPGQYEEAKKNPIPRKAADQFTKTGDIRHLKAYLNRTEVGREVLKNYETNAKDDPAFAKSQLDRYIERYPDILGITDGKVEKATPKAEKPSTQNKAESKEKDAGDDSLASSRKYAKDELARLEDYVGYAPEESLPDVSRLSEADATRLGDALNRAREASEIAAALDEKLTDDPKNKSVRKRFEEAQEKADSLLVEAQDIAQELRDKQDGNAKTLAQVAEEMKTPAKPAEEAPVSGKFKVGDRVADPYLNVTVPIKGIRKGKEGVEYDLGNGRWIREDKLDARNEAYMKTLSSAKKPADGPAKAEKPVAEKKGAEPPAESGKMQLKEALGILKGAASKSIEELKKMRNMWKDVSGERAEKTVAALDAVIESRSGNGNGDPSWVKNLTKSERAEYNRAKSEGDIETMNDLKLKANKASRVHVDERLSSKEVDETKRALGEDYTEDVNELRKKRNTWLMFAGEEYYDKRISSVNKAMADIAKRDWNALADRFGDIQSAAEELRNLDQTLKVEFVDGVHRRAYAEYDRESNSIRIYKDARMQDVMHEIGWHVMRKWAEKNSPEMLAKLKEYANEAPAELKRRIREAYSEFSEDAVLDEIGAARWMNEHGSDLFDAWAKNRTWSGKFEKAMKGLFVKAAEGLGFDVNRIDFKDAADTMTATEFADFMSREMLKGKSLEKGEKPEWIKPDAKPAVTVADGEPTVEAGGNRYSLKSMEFDLDDGTMVKELVRTGVYDEKGAAKWVKQVRKVMDLIRPERAILDINETVDKDGRRFVSYKENSDPLYKLSLDFSTLCKKRIFTQKIIDRLQSEVKGDFLSREEQIAVRDMLKEYQNVEKGLQVACHLCYVEAARLKAPEQQKRLFESKETMRSEFVNFLAKESPEFRKVVDKVKGDWLEKNGYDRDAKKSDLSGKDKDAFEAYTKEYRKTRYKPTDAEEKIIKRFLDMGKEPFLDSSKLMRLADTDPTIFKMYTGFIREATHSKSLEPDVPYYFGDSRMRLPGQHQMTDKFIKSMNSQGTGIRHQSWSDFQVQHLLDTVTALADLATRGAKMHAYTKVPEFVEIFGKSGIAYNLSLIPEKVNGKWTFSPVEGMDFKTAVKLRNKFSENVGTVAIAADFGHLKELLKNPYVDYVIPYHSSGMPFEIRKMSGIGEWRDFQDIQHTTVNKAVKKVGEVDRWHKAPELSEWLVDSGNGGKAAMQESAQRYVDLCNERGMRPKFAEVTGLFKQNADGTYKLLDKNYWKLLIDHKMVDHKTDKLVQQKAVRPEFDMAAVKRTLANEVSGYDEGLADRAFDYVRKEYADVEKRISSLKDGPEGPDDGGPGGGKRSSKKGIYTGSAADYDKPSLLKVGTGEGSQVYGWGLYGTDKRGVAERYARIGRDALSLEHVMFDGNPVLLQGKTIEARVGADIKREGFDVDKVKKTYKTRLDNAIRDLGEFKKLGWDPSFQEGQVNFYKENYDFIVKNGHKFSPAPDKAPGEHVYEQTFFTNRPKGDESHLLNWYEPLTKDNANRVKTGADKVFGKGSEMSKFIKESVDYYSENGDNGLNMDFYNDLCEVFKYHFDGEDTSPGTWGGDRNFQRPVSEFLAKCDIDGVKYPVDSYGKTVKNGDEAGWNYVSFRDDNIRVDHKWVDGEQRFSKKLTEAEGGTAADWTTGKESNTDKVRRIIQDHMLPERRMEERYGIGEEDSFYRAKDKNFGKNEYEAKKAKSEYTDKIVEKIADSGAVALGRSYNLETHSGEVSLDDYLIAKHAPERNRVLGDRSGAKDGSGMTDAQAEEVMRAFDAMPAEKRKAIEESAELVWKMNKEGLKRRLDSGRISQEEYDKLTSQWEHYVPLRTNMEEDAADAFNSGTAGMKEHEFHRALGRTTMADSPLVFSMLQANDAIVGSNKNMARKKLLKMVEDHPEMGQVWTYNGANGMWERMENGKRIVSNGHYNELDHNDIVLVKDNGVLKAMQFFNKQGEMIARSATDKGLFRWSERFDWIPRMTRWMAAMRTQYVPTFTVRNFITDHGEAFLNSIGDRGVAGAARFMGGVEKTFFSRELSRDMKAYFKTGSAPEGSVLHRFLSNGGAIGGGNRIGYSETANAMTDAIEEIRKGKFNAKGAIAKLKEMMSNLNERVELGTRVSVFKTAYESYLKNGMGEEEATKKAISYARDLTTNFNRKGEMTPLVNSLYMFSNAAIQGLSRSVKALNPNANEAGRKGAVEAVALLAAIGAAQAFWAKYVNDDEEEKRKGNPVASNTNEYTKQNSIEFGYGGKTLHAKVRYPWAVPMYVSRKMTELALGDVSVKDAVDDLGEGVVGAMLQEPVGHGGTALQTLAPSLLVPIVQLAEGKDYKGEDLYAKTYSKYKPDSENGRKSTEKAYKGISKGLNYMTGGNAGRKGYVDVAPESVKLAITTLMGGVGTDLGRIYNMLAKAKETISEGSNKFELMSVPFLSDFVRGNAKVDGKYYETLDKYEADVFEYKNSAGKDAVSFLREHRHVKNERMKTLAKEIKDLSHRENGEVKDGNRYVPNEHLTSKVKELAGDMKRRKMAEFIRLYEQSAK